MKINKRTKADTLFRDPMEKGAKIQCVDSVKVSALKSLYPIDYKGVFLWSGKRGSNSRPVPWQGLGI